MNQWIIMRPRLQEVEDDIVLTFVPAFELGSFVSKTLAIKAAVKSLSSKICKSPEEVAKEYKSLEKRRAVKVLMVKDD